MSTEQHEALLTWLSKCNLQETDEAAQVIQSQHALIVQMAEALDDMTHIYPPTDGARNAIPAATQYLKGSKT